MCLNCLVTALQYFAEDPLGIRFEEKVSTFLINDNTHLIISCIYNCKTLIFINISVILCQTNACMQRFQFVIAFYCANGSQAMPALV